MNPNKNQKNKISLIVLNYNGVHLLNDYFTSVFSQTLIPDEIIMFDNLDSDGSRDFVKKKFPKVKVLIEDRFNTGTALAVNTAVKSSVGDFIVLQMNDIILDKNCIKSLHQKITADPDIGIVSSVTIREQNRLSGNFLVDHAGGFLDLFGSAFPNQSQVPLKDIPQEGEVTFAYGDSIIFRRDAFNLAGGLDVRMFMMNDDIDFSWRVRLLGFTIYYTKSSVIYHKGSVTIKSLYDRPQIRFWSERNLIRTYLKNTSNLHLVKTLPMFILIVIGQFSYFLCRGKFRLAYSDLKAILWNIYYLPETLFLRIRILKSKKKNIDRLFVNKSFKLMLFKNFSKSL